MLTPDKLSAWRSWARDSEHNFLRYKYDPSCPRAKACPAAPRTLGYGTFSSSPLCIVKTGTDCAEGTRLVLRLEPGQYAQIQTICSTPPKERGKAFIPCWQSSQQWENLWVTKAKQSKRRTPYIDVPWKIKKQPLALNIQASLCVCGGGDMNTLRKKNLTDSQIWKTIKSNFHSSLNCIDGPPSPSHLDTFSDRDLSLLDDSVYYKAFGHADGLPFCPKSNSLLPLELAQSFFPRKDF